ncbi:MAG: hypothetical protein J0I20_09395 [Chloroflexi bacterium]|nr:hypothetical protein [Chloroflexota bacterium]OJV94673.1 MAG: hypothetical protein BGO39_23420 [Chloroflexi bacterium 54-19]
MEWLYHVAYFFGGLFLTNAIPHFVTGLMGRPFQTPFAHPSGVGLSTSTLNVVWAFINLVLGYVLVCQVGNFDLRSWADAITLGLALLLGGLFTAWNFGRINGGNNPEDR